jgi:hypothetical protein
MSLSSKTRRGGLGHDGAFKEDSMKTAVAAGVTVLLAAAASRAEAPAPPVGERFAWMAGCWGGEKGTTAFRETWTVASPDLLLGISATTRPSRPAEFEFLRIEGRPAGPAYVAQPGGVPPTAFAWSAADSTADTATFVNMQHDFPKRVSYRRVDGESLLAWIDGGPKGSMRIEFPMARVPCPGPSAAGR